MDLNDFCIIRPKDKHDYMVDAYIHEGINHMIPYKDYNLFMRVLREAWFRLHLPCREIWYNSKIRESNYGTYIVKDSLITDGLISWIRKYHQDARIIIDYDNRADALVKPTEITDKSVELWSYDPDDCEKYGMKYKKECYFDIYRFKNEGEKEYDVIYLGRDKGRAGYLFKLRDEFEKMGLRVYMRICADRKFLFWKHSYYKPVLDYDQYLEILKKSRAILNIMPEGQKSITMREMEAVFDGIKCITNNKGIKDFEFYDKSRFFLIGEDNMDDIPEFLSVPFKPIDDRDLEKYRFIVYLENMLKK